MSTERRAEQTRDVTVEDKGVAMCEIETEWRISGGSGKDGLVNGQRDVGITQFTERRAGGGFGNVLY